jgi:hypothetical protein
LFKNDKFQKTPYNRFEEFISPDIDRFALLCSVLDDCSLPHQILEIEKNRHVLVGSLTGSGKPIFTAHYDRVPKSPGANDNAAAVFLLIETALNFSSHHNNKALFIFTDGEELSKGENLSQQGSYSLGLHLKKNGLENSPIFTFDACGTGDTLVISTAAEELLKHETGEGAETARRKAQALRRFALEAARTARLEKVLLLPTPFSEDAGFLLSGMTAQTITVLPHSEAALVQSNKNAFFSNKDRRLIPETWRSLNGPSDSPLRLTPEHWKNIPAFAEALAVSNF